MFPKTLNCALFISLVLVPSLGAAAQRVAVLPLDCRKIAEAGAAEECSEGVDQVAKKTISSLEEAGFSPMSPEEVTKALESKGDAASLPCDDSACVSAVGALVEADEAVQIHIEDRRAAEDAFLVKVVFGQREGFSLESGSFYVLLEKLSSKISIFLLRDATAPQEAAASDEEAMEEETAEEEADPSEPEQPTGKLSPTAFWVSLGVTGALALGSIFTGAAFHSKYDSLENQDPWERSQSDWDSAHGLQITCRVFLGLTVAGALTTAVLFFFTDLDKKNEETTGLILSPSLSRTGGSMSLDGGSRCVTCYWP